MATVSLAGGRRASYEVGGTGKPTLMLPGGPGFAASYMCPEAELFADTLQRYLIDPHVSGASTPPPDVADYSPEGHARFYDEVRQAIGLDTVCVLGHSFGATTALTFAALCARSVERCIAVAAFGIETEVDASNGGDGNAVMEAMLGRHANASWYPEARSVMDQSTDRILATDDPAEMEQMMATVLPFYMAHPDRPEVSAALDEFRHHLKADLALGKAWEGGLYQTIDLRQLLGRITCPTFVIAGELDFISGPTQARPIASAIRGARLLVIPDCGHSPSIEAPPEYRQAVLGFLSSQARRPMD
jgi:pimeloyl-ACP methyl ester carboxylesterase